MTYEEVKQKHWMDLDTMEREEAEWIMDYGKRYQRRMYWEDALKEAQVRVMGWITEADEEHRLYLSYLSLAKCVASWRRTKTWATFIGRA